MFFHKSKDLKRGEPKLPVQKGEHVRDFKTGYCSPKQAYKASCLACTVLIITVSLLYLSDGRSILNELLREDSALGILSLSFFMALTIYTFTTPKAVRIYTKGIDCPSRDGKYIFMEWWAITDVYRESYYSIWNDLRLKNTQAMDLANFPHTLHDNYQAIFSFEMRDKEEFTKTVLSLVEKSHPLRVFLEGEKQKNHDPKRT